MIAALGVGAYTAAAFHLVTHAFFKALLFLGSGSVIHGMEHGLLHTGDKADPQDMLNMGGLRKKMPRTFYTFLAGGLALSGFPLLTSGFWSKDEILSGAFKGGQMTIFIMLALAALLTAFYTMRQVTLTFLGEPRSKSSSHAIETSKVMTLPLAVLAFFAITAGWVGIPQGFPGLGGILPNWIEEFLGHALNEGGIASHSPVPLITSLVVSPGGLLLGWLVYRGYKAGEMDPLKKSLGPVHTLLNRKYYIDELYQLILIKPSYWVCETLTAVWVDKKVIDGILHGIGNLGLSLGKILRDGFDQPVVNGAGNGLGRGLSGMGFGMRGIQSGKVQQYMLYALGGVILAGILIYLFMGQV
jgi:NADH-quinone oxidoreductase subunit L